MLPRIRTFAAGPASGGNDRALAISQGPFRRPRRLAPNRRAGFFALGDLIPQHLAMVAIERASIVPAHVLALQRNLAARTNALVVHQPMLAQHERLLPFKEI